MVLLLKDSDVVAAIDGEDEVARSVEALEHSFAAFHRNETSAPAFGYAAYPPGAQTYADTETSLNVPVGIVPSMNAMALGIVPIHKDHVRRDHSLWQFLVSYETFALECIMEDHTLHTYMVGAQFGVAAKWLAAEDASVVGMVGSGRMAVATLRAIKAVRPIEEVRVFSPNAEHREAFASFAADDLGLRAVVCDSPEKAVRDAQIVQCATNAEVQGYGQVVDAEWLSPGALVMTMSRNELGEDTAKIARVVPSARSQVLIVRPEWEPWKRLIEDGTLADLGPDLGAVVIGEEPGRTSSTEINVYLGSNLGSHRVAMARWAYDEALRKGVGFEWELD